MNLKIGKNSDFADDTERYLCSRYEPFKDRGLICHTNKDKTLKKAHTEGIVSGAVAWLGTMKAVWKVSPEAFVALSLWKKPWSTWLCVNYFLVDYSPSSRSGKVIEAELGWLDGWKKECDVKLDFKKAQELEGKENE